jgi:hypothetical protein
LTRDRQQIQGEVLEQDLRLVLEREFRDDVLEDLPTGRAGGDVVQHVRLTGGGTCGSIVWELKNTKTFNPEWLPKIRKDQRDNNADLAVIVSMSLPKGLDGLDWVDNVWVTSPRHAVALAKALRQSLIERTLARTASKDRANKAEHAYDYLTSQTFRQRIMAIVEFYDGMKTDLDTEKRSIQKLWSKREKQLDGLILQTAGLCGDLQGILGKSMPKVEGLDLQYIEAPVPIPNAGDASVEPPIAPAQ